MHAQQTAHNGREKLRSIWGYQCSSGWGETPVSLVNGFLFLNTQVFTKGQLAVSSKAWNVTESGYTKHLSSEQGGFRTLYNSHPISRLYIKERLPLVATFDHAALRTEMRQRIPWTKRLVVLFSLQLVPDVRIYKTPLTRGIFLFAF